MKDGRVVTLTSRNGLPCDAVHWSMEDDDHSVWLYMACGSYVSRGSIGRVDSAAVSDPTRRIQTTVFDSSDGVRASLLYRQQPRSPSPQTANCGSCLGMASASLIRVTFHQHPSAAGTHRAVTADRKTYDATSGALRLPPLVRDLEIDYTALSLVAPEKNLFRYKLEGRDSDWQDVGNRRQAFYNNLAPGIYRFRVIACNNSGVWNEAGAFLDFSIAPAYYQTTWFRRRAWPRFWLCSWALYQLRLAADGAAIQHCAWKSASTSGRASRGICTTRCCRVFKESC